MRRIFSFLIFMLAVATVFAKPQNDKFINNKWKLIEKNNKQVDSVANSKTFILKTNPDRFELISASGEVLSRGIWKLNGDSLQLFFMQGHNNLQVDSISIENQDYNSKIHFFNKGKEVATLDQGNVNVINKIESFKIYISADTLVLVNAMNKYTYISNKQNQKNKLIQAKDINGFEALARGFLGLAVLILIGYIFSTNRKAINWKTVLYGLAFQIVIAIGVLKVPFIQAGFEIAGKMFIKVLNFTEDGSKFLFGDLVDPNSFGFIFAFQVLPTIVFFSALSSLLYYYGIIQKVVYFMALILKKALKLSGAESLSASGNIFLGQTEAPLLIKAYLDKMTKSEIMLVMVGGMATIAGGVLAIYIKFLGGDDPMGQMLFAKHLITASVMAAPGAVVAAKLLVPQTEEIKTDIEIPKEHFGSNVLQAISNGTTEGIKLAVNVGAMLLVFIAFIALFNYIFLKIGEWTHLNQVIADFTNGQYKTFSLQFILGYALAPLTWIVGVNSHDITLVGQLLGEKIILNELIGYTSLKHYMEIGAFVSEKSIIIATYILCGFANVGSIGIQLGGIGALAPNQKKTLSELGVRALLGGTLASLLSATIIGVIMSF